MGLQDDDSCPHSILITFVDLPFQIWWRIRHTSFMLSLCPVSSRLSLHTVSFPHRRRGEQKNGLPRVPESLQISSDNCSRSICPFGPACSGPEKLLPLFQPGRDHVCPGHIYSEQVAPPAGVGGGSRIFLVSSDSQNVSILLPPWSVCKTMSTMDPLHVTRI